MYVPSYEYLSKKWADEDQLALDNKRRAAEDARRAAIFQRQQQQWADEDAGRNASVKGMQGMLDDSKDGVPESDWRTKLGVPPTQGGSVPATPRAPAAQPVTAPAAGLSLPGAMQPPAPTPDAPAGDPGAPAPKMASASPGAGVQPPTAPQPKAGVFDAEEKALRSRIQVAMERKDPNALSELQASYIDLQKRKVKMAISDHFDNADAAERERLTNSITADKTNHIKAILDPGSGYTYLRETDDGTVTKMSWGALKKYIMEKAVGNIDGMAKAMDENTARADKDSALTVQMTKLNNDSNYKGETNATKLEIAAMRMEMAAAKMALTKVGKEMSSEDATRLNEMNLAIDDAKTPDERMRAIGMYKRTYANVMGKMGKVVGNTDDKPMKDIPEADLETVMAGLRGDPANKGLGYQALRDKATEIKRGAPGGVQAIAPPRRDVVSRPTLGGQSGSHTPVAPSTNLGLQKTLSDIDARMKLPGISPEAQLGLILQRQQLTGGNSALRGQ